MYKIKLALTCVGFFLGLLVSYPAYSGEDYEAPEITNTDIERERIRDKQDAPHTLPVRPTFRMKRPPRPFLHSNECIRGNRIHADVNGFFLDITGGPGAVVGNSLVNIYESDANVQVTTYANGNGSFALSWDWSSDPVALNAVDHIRVYVPGSGCLPVQIVVP